MLESAGLALSILTTALKLRGARDKELNAADLEALTALHGTVSEAFGLRNPGPPTRQDVELDGLLLAAFGEALGGLVHFADSSRTGFQHLERRISGQAASELETVPEGIRSFGARMLRRLQSGEDALRADLETRLEAVLSRGGEGGGPIAEKSPLTRPLYRALRLAVSDPGLGAPLIEPPELLTLDRDFLMAWRGRLARRSDLGAFWDTEPARVSLEQWELALHEQADWGDRQVFGNLRRGEGDPGVPFLSLDGMYVEPAAKPARTEAEPVAVRGLIREHLEQSRVVAVQADFGMGKSLTARALARDLAREWLDSGGQGWLPLYVRCADDLRERRMDLPLVLRGALWRILLGAGLDLSVDQILAHERPGARTLIILDGLDEVELGSRNLNEFFKELERLGSVQRRFLVLSRPGALPHDLPKEVPLLELQPFDNERVGAWLDGWCVGKSLPGTIRAESLAARGLLDLARTPILLLMIVWTWDEQSAEADIVDIYERFMVSLARGKFERDSQEHPTIAAASQRLAEALRDRGELEEAEPVEAMLWMLGRAAWEARILQHKRPIEIMDADNLVALVKEDCGLKGDLAAVASVKLGLLLALQVDPRGDGGRILFGHRSFAEYLGARHWEGAVRRALRLPRARRERSAKVLELAPVAVAMREEDRLFEFLVKRVSRWSDSEQIKLHDWTIELLEAGVKEGEFHEQTGWQLRRSLLSVASSLETWPGWLASETDVLRLRTLLVWPWAVQRDCRLTMRKVRSDLFLDLSQLNLQGADLSHSQLAGVQLRDTNLAGSCINYCIFTHASAFRTYLLRAIGHHVNLAGSQLVSCRIHRTDLTEANLSNVRAYSTSFYDTILFKSNLSNILCRDARFCGANLSYATLTNATMENVDLTGATLYGADLTGATLTDCTFGDPNDPGNNPITLWDETTRWPEGFTPPVPPTPQTPKPS